MTGAEPLNCALRERRSAAFQRLRLAPAMNGSGKPLTGAAASGEARVMLTSAG
jgi:hypothetical protein